MYKLRKMYLGTIGNESSWHNGTLLDCTKEDEPIDTYGCLINGGGKTTLVGLFFSVPIPHKNKFIPHIVNTSLVMEDYYRMNVPGYVCLEWEFSSKSDGAILPMAMGLIPKKRYVIGSIGYKSVVSGVITLDRLFYSVRLSQNFEFEDLPLPVINNAEASQLVDFEGVRKWASSMKARLGDSFFSYQSHTDWQKHLVGIGFNIHDFDVQVKMNLEEGGATKVIENLQSVEIATGKRDFKFVEWMLNTVLDQDEYMNRRTDLFDVCKKLKDIPKAEESLRFLGQMKAKCEEISETLSTVNRFSKDLHNVNSDIEFIHQFLQKLLHDTTLSYNNEVLQQTETSGLIKTIKADLESVITQEESLSYVISKRRVEELTSLVEAIAAKIKATENEFEVCKNVLKYLPTHEKSEELKLINKEIAGAQDSDVSKNLRKTIANTLYFLDIEDENNKTNKKSYEESKTNQELLLKKTKSEKAVAEKDEAGINNKYGVSFGWLKKADEDYRSLIQTGVITDTIKPDVQYESVCDRLKKIDSDIEIHEQEARQETNEIKALESNTRDKENTVRASQKIVQDLTKDLDRFHHLTKSIHENRFFIHYIGESSNINENCVGILKQARLDKDKSRDNLVSSLTILEKNKLKAEKFNLPVSDDLWSVLFALTEAGIKSMPAISYIYESALENPEEIIASNDMFTQAIVVFDINKAMNYLNKQGVIVLSPVYIVDAKQVLGFSGVSYENVVRPCKFATDKEISAKYVQSIEAQITQLKIGIDESKKESDAILNFQNEISVYLQKYDKLYAESVAAEIAKTGSIIEELKSAIKAFKIEVEAIQSSINNTRVKILEFRKEKDRLIEKKSKIHYFLSNTWNLKPEYETRTANLKSELDAKRQEIETFKTAIADAESVLQIIENSINKVISKQNDLDRHKRKINSIISDVKAENNGTCSNVENGMRKTETLNEIYIKFLTEMGFNELKARAEKLRVEVNEETEAFIRRSKHGFEEICAHIESNPNKNEWEERSEVLRLKGNELSGTYARADGDLLEAKNKVPVVTTKHESFVAKYDVAGDEELQALKSECQNQIELLATRLNELEEKAVFLGNTVSALKLKKTELESNVQLFKKSGATVFQFDLDTYMPVNEVAKNIIEHSNFIKIKEILFSFSDQITKEIETLNALYSDCFDDYKNMLSTQVFEQMENRPAFVEYAKRTTREGLREAGEIQKLFSNIQDLIGIHEQTLISNKTYRQNAVETLIRMYHDGVMVLDKACSKSKTAPDGVRYIGGKQILKRTSDRNQKLGDEGVTALCEMYLSTLIQSPNFPKSGIDIVLDLLRKTHESGFGFKLIKYAPIPSAQYETINKLAMSGGERVLTAVMLYLLVRAVKAELSGNKEAPGGFLFFDNPFGKLTSPDFVETLKSIVAHAKCQLIAFSTIRTEAINSVFENFIIMAKATKLVGGSEVSLVNVMDDNSVVINSASYTMRDYD